MKLTQKELKEFLDEKAAQYNQSFFIEHDPIQVPKGFSKKEDIEISAFLTATIAWGQRTTIINNASRLMALMDDSPHDFAVNAKEHEFKPLESFVHRTFNGSDLLAFLEALKFVYLNHGGLEGLFSNGNDTKDRIVKAREVFFSVEHLKRTEKHFSNPTKGSSAKRINMFLRWMARQDESGVDFGIWKKYPMSELMCPLDIHSGNVARKLGILKRKQNDWTALEELMKKLRKFDPKDPVKYDFALFGIGAFEKIS